MSLQQLSRGGRIAELERVVALQADQLEAAHAQIDELVGEVRRIRESLNRVASALVPAAAPKPPPPMPPGVALIVKAPPPPKQSVSGTALRVKAEPPFAVHTGSPSRAEATSSAEPAPGPKAKSPAWVDVDVQEPAGEAEVKVRGDGWGAYHVSGQ